MEQRQRGATVAGAGWLNVNRSARRANTLLALPSADTMQGPGVAAGTRVDDKSMIEGRHDLRKAYQDRQTAREYVARRFETPLGALLHSQQVTAIREVIVESGVTRALEIAPGPARLTTDVVPFLRSLTLVDASQEMLSEARSRLTSRLPPSELQRVCLIQADAFRLPVAGPFDLAYTFRLIRHFERRDRLALYRQIATTLRPNGWLLFDAINRRVAAPLRARAKPGELHHFDALLTPEEIRAELKESGFRVARLVGAQRRMPALMWCQIYIAPRSGALARAAMSVIQQSGGEPLEWVVVCRRV